jgi:hypothetical protein
VFAGFYSQFVLPSNNITLGASPVFDSVQISFAYLGSYGDTSKTMTFNVSELSEALKRDSAYRSNRSFALSGTIGSVTFRPRLKDSVLVAGKKRAPQLRFRLDNAFGERIFNAINAGSAATDDKFQELFKGVYVSPDASSDGSILYFSPVSDQTRITLYYKNSSGPASLEIPSGSRAAKHNYFSHKYSGYINDTLVNSSSKSDSLLYLQSMSGLKVKITLPHIAGFGKRISIVKAELVVPAIPDADVKKYSVPDRLFLFEADSAGESAILADQLSPLGSNYYGGSYDILKNEYRFNLAKHIQELLAGEPEYGLHLVVGNPVSSAERVILLGNIKSSRKLKLQLTYTKLD